MTLCFNLFVEHLCFTSFVKVVLAPGFEYVNGYFVVIP